MKNVQIEIELDSPEKKLTVRDLSTGTVFRRTKEPNEVLMKVKSVNFLNNSGLLSDVFARGDCLVVNMRSGTVYVTSGSHEVIKLTGNLKVRKA